MWQKTKNEKLNAYCRVMHTMVYTQTKFGSAYVGQEEIEPILHCDVQILA
jgi:hypothetical protein